MRRALEAQWAKTEVEKKDNIKEKVKGPYSIWSRTGNAQSVVVQRWLLRTPFIARDTLSNVPGKTLHYCTVLLHTEACKIYTYTVQYTLWYLTLSSHKSVSVNAPQFWSGEFLHPLVFEHLTIFTHVCFWVHQLDSGSEQLQPNAVFEHQWNSPSRLWQEEVEDSKLQSNSCNFHHAIQQWVNFGSSNEMHGGFKKE